MSHGPEGRNPGIDISDLRAGLARVAAAMERDFEMLNSVDGALGDGDLGVTMTRGMRAISEKADDLPNDLGMALLACAQAFTKSSGSSYGTLLAKGMMAIAKAVKGRTEVEAAEISGFAASARDAMQALGKAELGGKTVLDSLDAVAAATVGKNDPADVADAAAAAVDAALDAFRDKKATIGRARIFGEKSVGLDDPGMLAMARAVKALADR
ncbi:MAG: dihydroxyacetone kinase subunit L [Paracoccaceae bacterium]|nr:dihydroxyacetone kinase subunit L [Paracoccaceae bacterium]